MYHFQSPKLGVAHREALQKVRDANNFNAAMFHGCFVLHIYMIISPTDIGVKNPNPKCLMDGLNYME